MVNTKIELSSVCKESAAEPSFSFQSSIVDFFFIYRNSIIKSHVFVALDLFILFKKKNMASQFPVKKNIKPNISDKNNSTHG
jgi:hypothetical protein